MGTTLENGVYLPSEGERNCYAGLKTNWEILDQKVADVTALQQAVAGALHREIVESLPTTDINPNTIYMILSGTSATENVYNEYMYVNNAWELIGTSATDLTNYYTKAEVDGKLLLKANDSDVVHKSGNETVGGTKTFSNRAIFSTTSVDSELTLKQNAYDPAKNGQSALSSTCSFNVTARSVTNGSFAQIGFYGAPGFTTTRLNCRYYTGASESEESWVEYTVTGTSGSIIGRSFKPYNNGLVDLGTNANRWKSVYATNYYYGSNNVEFSDKFVTTDTNQIISGNKIFSKYITSDGSYTGDEYSGNTRTNLWLMSNRDTAEVSGILFDTYRQNTAQGTGMHILGIGIKENSVRYEGCRWGWYWDNNSNGYTFDFKPTTQGANQALKHNLGTSTDKWDTINGVEPSSLSLPDLDNGIDISSYITVNGGNKESFYTPPANGWISVALTKAKGAHAVMLKQGNFASSGHNIAQENGTTACNAMLPVKGGVQVSINSALADRIVFAYFYPCQGNV